MAWLHTSVAEHNWLRLASHPLSRNHSLWESHKDPFLKPLLFSTYYQPVTAIARKHGCSYHVYADIMQVYDCFKSIGIYSPASLVDALGRIETCIVQIQQWTTSNKLRLNSVKTELLVAVSPHHQRLVNKAKPVLRISGLGDIPQCVCVQSVISIPR